MVPFSFLVPFKILRSALTRAVPAKRQAVWRELSSVIEAWSPDQFEELFQTVVVKWAADNDTKDFSEYIRREYANKKECYRNGHGFDLSLCTEVVDDSGVITGLYLVQSSSTVGVCHRVITLL